MNNELITTDKWQLYSTFVEYSLQINLFMQSKPNFQKSQMNVSIYLQTAYENKCNWTIGQSKPNSNPIAERVKLMQSVYLQRNMKKNADMGYEKTNPNQTQFKPNLETTPGGPHGRNRLG